MTINGNGGFIGLFLKEIFLSSIFTLNNIFCIIYLLYLLFSFFKSINFKFLNTFTYINNISNLFRLKKNYQIISEDENIAKENFANENIHENKKVQDSLPFDNKSDTNIKNLFYPK